MTTSNTGTTHFNFPHPELDRIDGAPDYLAIQRTRRQLMANAISVHSGRGNGVLGHAQILLGTAAYNQIANQAAGGNAFDWDMPVHPGNAPIYPAGAGGNPPSAATVARAQEEYARDLKDFMTYNDLTNALSQQFIAAVDNIFICSLQDPLYDDSEPSEDELRAIFARGIESSDWNDPAMDVCDEYDKHKP